MLLAILLITNALACIYVVWREQKSINIRELLLCITVGTILGWIAVLGIIGIIYRENAENIETAWGKFWNKKLF